MSIWSRHPTDLNLSLFADGEVSPERARRIARHLEDCTRCREEVELFREMEAAAAASAETLRDAPVPDASETADRVLRRRREGERVDLLAGGNLLEDGHGPRADGEAEDGGRAEDDGRPAGGAFFGSRGFSLALAASVAVAMLAAGYVLLVPPAGAHRSELRFDPSPPAGGDTVRVAYSPASYLAEHDSLRLRVRVREEASPVSRTGVFGEHRTATLHRNPDGDYEGRIVLDPDHLYLAAAVEDFAAAEVDANFGRLWDAVMPRADGEPGAAALESRYRVLERANSILATEWAAEIIERYPDNPFGWATRFIYESRVQDTEAPDSLVEFHRGKLHELLGTWRSRETDPSTADPDAIAWLAEYARFLGEDRLQDSLVSRLAEIDPGHDGVARHRTMQAFLDHDAGSPAILAELDRAWRESGGNHNLFQLGLNQAARRGDDAAVRRWLSRRGPAAGRHDGQIAARLDPYDEYAAERIDLRRARLVELSEAGDEMRPLHMSAAEFAAEVELEARSLRTALAGDLAVVGDTAGALVLFREAADRAWRPETLEPFVDFLLATGDTAEALDAIAVLRADPLGGERAAEEYATVVERLVSDSAAFLARGRSEWAERVRSSRIYGPRLPGRTDLAPASGEPFPAATLSGTPAVLLSWQWVAPPSDDVLRTFSEAADRFGTGPTQFLAVTHEAPRPASRDAAGEVPILVDHGFEIRRALQTYSAPTYVILDDRLTVAARTPDLDTALRIAEALSMQ